jgi:hypothetical protein
MLEIEGPKAWTRAAKRRAETGVSPLRQQQRQSHHMGLKSCFPEQRSGEASGRLDTQMPYCMACWPAEWPDAEDNELKNNRTYV